MNNISVKVAEVHKFGKARGYLDKQVDSFLFSRLYWYLPSSGPDIGYELRMLLRGEFLDDQPR